ncbi:MAG: ABA4-like family protein [Pirellulales bacterium]
MDPARLFDVVSWIGLPGWLLLAVVPRWRWTPLVTACILPSVLAAIYLVLLASNIGTAEGGFGSLSGVKSLFAVDALLLAGWIHYLAFDLFVGSWQVRDAQRVGIRHSWVLPCLVLTLMAGPVGLLAYWILRSILVRKPFLRETPAPQSSPI